MVLHPRLGEKPNIDEPSVAGVPGLIPGGPAHRLQTIENIGRGRGFEPPTPWSRTRFNDLLKRVEIE
jgi:hypothetical protein